MATRQAKESASAILRFFLEVSNKQGWMSRIKDLPSDLKAKQENNNTSVDNDKWIYSGCQGEFGNVLDVKATRDWFKYMGCNDKFNDSCDWNNEIIDDNDMFCKHCLLRENYVHVSIYRHTTLIRITAEALF